MNDVSASEIEMVLDFLAYIYGLSMKGELEQKEIRTMFVNHMYILRGKVKKQSMSVSFWKSGLCDKDDIYEKDGVLNIKLALFFEALNDSDIRHEIAQRIYELMKEYV